MTTEEEFLKTYNPKEFDAPLCTVDMAIFAVAEGDRKLIEKTGIETPYLEQVESIGNASRDPRGWSVTLLYFALIDFDAYGPVNGSEETQWVSIVEALKQNLAFDHKILLRRYTALPVSLMPEHFTLTELQNMFELILDSPLQKKSFRRRIETSGLLVETGEMRPTIRRPAALFRRSDIPGLLDVKLEVL